MKKMLLVFALILGSIFAANAQAFNPYVNAGVGLSSGALSYTGQVGAKGSNTRYAATVASVTRPGDNLWKLGAIGYYKLNSHKMATPVDVFATGAMDFTLTSAHAVTLTPGLATVFNFKSQLKPELSVGFPFAENSVLRNRPVGIIAGVSVNYVF